MDYVRRPTPRVVVISSPAQPRPKPDSEHPNPLGESVLLTTPNAEYILTAERVVIGRAPTCDVVIEDSLVSWEHAIIRIGPTAAVIEDRQSSNGVYVNDVRLSEPYQLCDGDRILVGTQQLSVFSAVSRRRLQRSLGGPTDSAS